MSYACIDIGSNTTRLLVAECREGKLIELASERAFTRINRGLRAKRKIAPEKIVETAETVARQARAAREMGVRDTVVVATAAVREAKNSDDLVDAIRRAAGLETEILPDAEEARLAFVGATKTLPTPVDGPVAVVDIGGGSTEVAVGTVADGVSWWTSVPLGSGYLTDAHLSSDPPAPAELQAARDEVTQAFDGLEPPPSDRTVAVGGSARSLRKLVGQELTSGTLARALAILASTPAEALAERFDVTPERTPLLPAGALILDGLLSRLGPRIAVGQGGLREGLILELESGRRRRDGGDARLASVAAATTSEP